MQKGKISIVSLGALNIDLISYMKKLPTNGETVHGTHYVTDFGGKAGNQAVAAAKLGGEVSLIGRLGSDTMANDYITTLTQYGIDVSDVFKTKGASNGTAMLMVSEDGNHLNAIIAGANEIFSEKDVLQCTDKIKSATILMVQLEVNVNCTLKALELCTGTSILNASPAIEVHNDTIFTFPKYFVVHDAEASVFCGFDVRNLNDAKAAVKELLRKGCHNVVLVMGLHGLVYSSKKDPNPVHVASPSTKVVDSTSHEDAFVGAFAYLLAYMKDDMTLVKLLKTALWCATDSTTREGIQKSFTTRDVFMKYMRAKN